MGIHAVRPLPIAAVTVAAAGFLRHEPLMVMGLMAGALGGLAGTLAMNEAQRAWTRVVDGDAPDSGAGKHDARDWQERSEHQNSNELAAQAVARCILRRPLTKDELRFAAPLTHFLFGAALGALYGVYAERRRRNSTGMGFGTTVWLLADEIAMPVLGLSAPTTRRPIEMHLQSFASHLVFGTAAEMTRRVVRSEGSVRCADDPRLRHADRGGLSCSTVRVS